MNTKMLTPEERRTWAQIDLDAAKSNFLLLKEKAQGKKVCAVIKANAYGHGAVRLAQLYELLGADFLAVSNFSEALEIRRAGVALPILVLGYVHPECAPRASGENITLAAYSLHFAKTLSEAALRAGKTVDVHLKFDTGMGRIGFLCENDGENSLESALLAARLPGLCVTGAFTHFSSADGGENEEDREYTLMQAKRFAKAKSFLLENGVELPLCHVSNSAGAIDYPELALDMVRFGISLYGLAP